MPQREVDVENAPDVLAPDDHQRPRTLRVRLRRLDGDERPLMSYVLHEIGTLSASWAATVMAALASLGALVAALVVRHGTIVLTVFEALASAVTLVMVFALQHSQYRQQAAVQRKLDALLRAVPGADTRLVHVETAAQEELDALDERDHRLRADTLGGDPTLPA